MFFYTKDTVVVVNVQTQVIMLAEWRGLKIVIHVIIIIQIILSQTS